MRFLSLAALSIPALLATAAPASADELDLGLRLGGRHGSGYVDVRLGGPRPAPVIHRPVRPMPLPVPVIEDDCHLASIPGHEVVRYEQVVEPAVYETRRIPVFEERRVPVYETVKTPVFDLRFDSRRGGRVRVRIGERLERVQVGERTTRVQVGERVERVLVRAETVRTVERREWVAARVVLVCDRPHRHRHLGRETMSVAEFEREMAGIRGRDGGHWFRPAGFARAD